ncbi:glucose-1-phosphate thymidylyltransferase [Actinokineospora sp. NBRC 105648]|uniref:glucose-1-phosphate thymidylyltransferase n=1 Tax=Actinokineospora sp. NBRC 105648 TaxID=3032206 RepID=UPI0024A0D1F4|nr:glucose-1-phosphate thymidylyltransferase [Actinokineospora sp. NBRC 105648]GLZ37787.1 glucose-1-phosphate thymidylyltransferase [Actinokineospora sp. NBRC 105648]
MKALVLAGGVGSRLRPLTYCLPKQLIPVAGRPVLEHCLADIRALGVTEVGIVVGEHAAQIEAAIGDGSRLGLRVTYLHQDRPAGLAHCVLIAADFLAGEDFVMYLGDNILVGDVAAVADEFRARRPAARLLVAKVSRPDCYGVVELGPDDTVLSVVEKAENPPSDLAIVGVYFFTAAIVGAAGRIVPSARGELEITDAIARLIEDGEAVVASRFTGIWKDTGTVEDLLECNRLLLADLPPAVRGDVDVESDLRGPVVVEAGATVIRSTIQAPALIRAGSVVRDSTIGPSVAVSENCVVTDADVADSILMAGTEIRGPVRLTGSLVGRGSEVDCSGIGADRSTLPAHRLLVGDSSRLQLNSPANPDGRVLTAAELGEHLDWGRVNGCVVVNDEC